MRKLVDMTGRKQPRLEQLKIEWEVGERDSMCGSLFWAHHFLFPLHLDEVT